MTPTIVLAAIVLLPVVILLFLRINAAVVFLSLCLGSVLVQYVAGDGNAFFALLTTNRVTATPLHASTQTLKLTLILVPVILTTAFMVNTVRGIARLALNVLPSAGVGLLGALLVVPLLSPGLSHNIVDSSLWSNVVRARDLIVGGSAIVCLLVLSFQRPRFGGSKHSKHKK